MPVQHNRSGKCYTQSSNRSSSSDDNIQAGLEASSKLSGELEHPGVDIRPCMALLIETSLAKGDFPDRAGAAVAIASELKRIGKDYDYTFRRIEQWNDNNRPPLKSRLLERAITNTFDKGYEYSCHNPALQAYCMDKDACPFVIHSLSSKRRHNDLVFVDYGWPAILSPSQCLVYCLGLTHLEKTRQLGPGRIIFASHRQIAEICGIHVRHVGEHLRELAKVGLIEYEPGAPRKWEGKASAINRVFPIARPKATHLIKKPGPK